MVRNGGTISKRQVSKIFPGTIYHNREFTKLKKELYDENNSCIVCGRKDNLEPHHIIPCNVYDELFLKKDNVCVICKPCHDRYHQNFFPINEETFRQYCEKYGISNTQKKKIQKRKSKKYSLKKYESSPLYSKIKVNDFTKAKPEIKPKKQKRKRKRRRRKLKRLNPIYLIKNLGSDEWDYIDKINLEKEVLGDLL